MQTLNIEHNKDLKLYNTFGLNCVAKQFIEITDENQLPLLHQAHQWNEIFFLGGGSNVILPPTLDRPVVHFSRGHIEITAESDDLICLQVDAGLVWHDLVSYCVAQGYGGIEQMALIPGLVGAAPVQNIGAYGVELCDVCTQVRCFDLEKKDFIYLTTEQCK